MTAWTLPPRAKIYEALSAVADGRVTLTGSTSAQVVSSSGEKTYTVTWTPDLREISANDSASVWQGYLGYPGIAVLLALGILSYDPAVAAALAGIPWQALNTRHKRRYDQALAEVLSHLPDPTHITAEVERIYAKLADLDLQRLAKRPRPAKG